MGEIPARIGPRMRAWLESPSPPPRPPKPRVSRKCTEPRCLTWVFGSTDREAEERLANHRLAFHSDHPKAHRR